MLYILLPFHSYLRWLIVLVAVTAAVKFTLGWLRGGAFKGMDRGLTAGFSGLMDLQAVIGIIMLVGLGTGGEGFPMIRIEHAVTMLIAVVLGHLPARWKNAADTIRFRNALFCILGAMLFVFVGVMRLPGGWSR
ncbi:MAG: hypothetical protein DPW18_07095 [Chloroflexi bacterium]|nr:hypothetical protein [Chloroflexota bacterium]MDL1942325.1 hypothetical protein [Chloroflexi bacterium CFX2]